MNEVDPYRRTPGPNVLRDRGRSVPVAQQHRAHQPIRIAPLREERPCTDARDSLD